MTNTSKQKKKSRKDPPEPSTTVRKAAPLRPPRPQESLFETPADGNRWVSWAEPDIRLHPTLQESPLRSTATSPSHSRSSSRTYRPRNFSYPTSSCHGSSERISLLSYTEPLSSYNSSMSSLCSSYSTTTRASCERSSLHRSELLKEAGESEDRGIPLRRERQITFAVDSGVETRALQREANRLPGAAPLAYNHTMSTRCNPPSVIDSHMNRPSPTSHISWQVASSGTGNATSLTRQPKTKRRNGRSNSGRSRSDSGNSDTGAESLSDRQYMEGTSGSWPGSSEAGEISERATQAEKGKGKAKETSRDNTKAPLREFGISPVRMRGVAIDRTAVPNSNTWSSATQPSSRGDRDDWFTREEGF